MADAAVPYRPPFDSPVRSLGVVVITLALMAGVLVGLVNGFVVGVLKVPSIIATLGIMISLTAIALT